MKTNYSVVPKVLRHNPEIAGYLFRTYARIKKSGAVDRDLFDGISHTKALFYFRITPLCNLNCVMCGQRGDKGVLKGSYAAKESKKIVPIERYKKLVDELKESKPVFYMWGGEPFLYPDFMELAKYIVDSGIILSVNTNGTFLEKYAQRIVKDEWHALFVSLDGFEDVNDSIRGKGSYKRVIDGFKAINREKERQGKSLPYMGIVTTVSNKNYLYLDKLAEAAKDFGLGWHIINLGTYTNDNVVREHKKEFKEKLGVESKCLEAYNTGYNEGIDAEKFKEILNRVHAMKNGYPIITVPAINPEKIGEYYSNPEIPVRKDCPVPWGQANFDYNGDVHFCADYPDYVIGNIMDSTFDEIYNNDKAKKFRTALKNSENGCFKGCLRCYQNMLFGKKIKGY